MRKYTIRDFEREFPSDDACLEWLKNHLYPNGIFCKNCQKVTKHHKVGSRRSYSCDYCGNHVHPTAGTVYEKSTTPLRLWFYATYLMSSTRTGISAKQLQRQLGVTYKTAWRIFKQVRSMLTDDGKALTGQVEVDETYIGGKRPGKRGRGAEGKTPVLGMVKRKGKVVARVIPDTKSRTVMPIVREHVVPVMSTVFTDEYGSYNSMRKAGYPHERVHHAAKVWVSGTAHTNTIEGFWSLVKRGINGVYHAVSPKYLQSYLDEYSFRYNHRDDEVPMFKTVLCQTLTL